MPMMSEVVMTPMIMMMVMMTGSMMRNDNDGGAPVMIEGWGGHDGDDGGVGRS